MCGISGVFNVQSSIPDIRVRDRLLRDMIGSMVHRGPDAEGIWHDPQGRCSLGHRRLSIIDTSQGGLQPMSDLGGRRVVSFNGEIYNFLELRPELEAAGMPFRGRTDTEVLLQSLARWGLDALPRLDGMFAFAAFDREAGELILARDPFGEKPLYYMELPGGGLAFASELQALHRVPGFDAEVSSDAMAEMLMFQYIGAPRTIYKNVKKLPPGHWLVASAGSSIRTGRYYEFRPGTEGFDRRPLQDLADELEALLVQSVRRRLISDVPLGAFLSGGVDSSTVCALITKRLGLPLKTFSIGFKRAPESEHEAARAFAAHLGCEHRDQILAPDTSEFLAGIGAILDEPNGDSSCMPTYLLSEFARRHVTVAVSGDGGDEMFAGYGRYFMTLDEEQAGKLATTAPGMAYYSGRILVSTERYIEELFGTVPPGLALHLHHVRAQVDRTEPPLFCRLRKTDVDNYLPGAVLPKVDRMSMQHSLEVRTPFLNTDLARFVERLPLSHLYHAGKGKLLLREVAYRYLPRKLIDAPKKGFGLPMARWARRPLLSVAGKLLQSDESRLREALGSEAVDRFLRRQRSLRGFSAYQVWALVTLESWLRHHPARLPTLRSRAGNRTKAPHEAEASTSDAGRSNTLIAWPVAADYFAVVEDASMPLDTAERSSEAERLLQAEVSALLFGTLRWDRERGFAERVDGTPDGPGIPVQIPRWGQPASAQDVGNCASLRGATLLFPQPDAIKRVAVHDVAALSRLGVSRFVFFRPGRHGRAPISFKPTASTPVARLRHAAVLWQTRLAFYIAGLTHLALRIARSTGMAFRIARFAYRTIAGRPSHSLFMKTLHMNLAAERRLPSVISLEPGDRVVVLTHALPPGGAERQWCYLAAGLKSLGFEVAFVVTNPLRGADGHYAELLRSFGIEPVVLGTQPLADVIAHVPRGKEFGRLLAPGANPFGMTLSFLTSYLKALRPKVVFAQLDSPNLLAGVAGHLARVPKVVLSFRNYNPSHFSYLDTPWYQPCYQALAQSGRITFSGNSRAGNDDYADWIGVPRGRVCWVPNAIDPSDFPVPSESARASLQREMGLHPAQPVILGVFRLSEEKRPELFVRVCALAAKRIPSLRVLLAGIGPLQPETERAIRDGGLEEQVTLLGRRDDVLTLMSLASVVLLTSRHEGMPNVLMEAQLLGIPVVATRVGGAPDCVLDGVTGFLADPDDPQGLADACVKVLSDPQLAATMGAHGAGFMRAYFNKERLASVFVQLVTRGVGAVDPLAELGGQEFRGLALGAASPARVSEIEGAQ